MMTLSQYCIWTESLKYLDVLENDLKCKICSKIAVEPQSFSNCQHFFCKSCIDYSRNHCVVCNVPSFAKDIISDCFIENITNCVSNIKGLLLKSPKTTDTLQKIALCPERNTLESKDDGSTCEIFKKPIVSNSSPGHSKAEAPPKLTHKDHLKPPKRNGSKDRGPPKITPIKKPANGQPIRFAVNTSKEDIDTRYTTPKKKIKQNYSGDVLPKNLTQSTKKSANKRNMRGETPLHVACIKGNVLQVQTLIDNGANPNVKDNFGWTPLHEALHHKQLEISKILLEKGGAWVNTPGGENITPLHNVAAFNWVEGVKVLMEWGANPRIVDIYGRTPMNMTTSEEIIKIMESPLADPRKCTLMNPYFSDLGEQDERTVLFGDNLSKTDQKFLSKLSLIIPGTRISNLFSSDVTHIVVNVENGICNPTVKVLNAMLTGKLIVSMEWVQHSINIKSTKHHHNPGVKATRNYPFSNGVIKARLFNKKLLPSLFSGMYFSKTPLCRDLTYENLKKEDLVKLVNIGGGHYLSREPDPEAIPLVEKTVPFYANNSIAEFADISRHIEDILNSSGTKEKYIESNEVLDNQMKVKEGERLSGLEKDHPLKKCSHVILYQDDDQSVMDSAKKGKTFLRYNMAHLKSLPVAWFIGCIESFTLLDPSPFL